MTTPDAEEAQAVADDSLEMGEGIQDEGAGAGEGAMAGASPFAIPAPRYRDTLHSARA